METTEELSTFLTAATVDGILGRLLYRGAAWSLMRKNGVLPQNAPPLGATIETDLAEHGFALLRGAMALRAQAGASELTGKAFERAANAFEALVRNGDPESPDRGFRRTIAAAAYHLAGFSAVAFSIFNEIEEDLNVSPGEIAIRHLILRDLDQLRGFVRDWLNYGAHGDEQIAAALQGGVLTSTKYCRQFSIRRSAVPWHFSTSRLRRARLSRSKPREGSLPPLSGLPTTLRTSRCGGSRTSAVT